MGIEQESKKASIAPERFGLPVRRTAMGPRRSGSQAQRLHRCWRHVPRHSLRAHQQRGSNQGGASNLRRQINFGLAGIVPVKRHNLPPRTDRRFHQRVSVSPNDLHAQKGRQTHRETY